MDEFPVDPYPIGWYLTAFSDELEPGSVKRLHYFGQELVCYRGRSGAVQTMDAYCPHQGAHLGWGGEVAEDDIICPFHSWRFGPDGSNVRIPYAERDCDAYVRTWPTLEQDGMVFIWHDPDQAEPGWNPQPIPEFNDPQYSSTWRSEPIDINVHPQDVLENGVDAAHFVSVHRAFAIPEVNIVVNEGPHFVAEMPDQQLRSDRGPFSANVSSEFWGMGIDIARMRSSFMSIVYVMLLTPVDESTIRSWFHVTLRRLGKEDAPKPTPEFVARIGDGLVAEFLNDKVIWEHKIYRPRPRLAKSEEPVRELRRWAQQFYPSRLAAAASGQ